MWRDRKKYDRSHLTFISLLHKNVPSPKNCSMPNIWFGKQPHKCQIYNWTRKPGALPTHSQLFFLDDACRAHREAPKLEAHSKLQTTPR